MIVFIIHCNFFIFNWELVYLMVSSFLTDKMCVPKNSAVSQSFCLPECARSVTGALFVQALFFKRKVQISLRSDLNLKFKRLEIHIIFLIPFFIKSLKKVPSESYCVSRPLQLRFHQAVFPFVNIWLLCILWSLNVELTFLFFFIATSFLMMRCNEVHAFKDMAFLRRWISLCRHVFFYINSNRSILFINITYILFSNEFEEHSFT